MDKIKKEEHKCNECKKDKHFESANDLRKHEWTHHPKNEMEKAWAKHALENFRNWKGSSYYESFGPYY